VKEEPPVALPPTVVWAKICRRLHGGGTGSAAVERLLKAGADLRERDEHGFAAIHGNAAWRDAVNMTCPIGREGVNVNAQISTVQTGRTSRVPQVHIAVEPLLLENGVAREARDVSSRTPLFPGVIDRQEELIEAIVRPEIAEIGESLASDVNAVASDGGSWKGSRARSV
jgi:hypothetical protein